MLYPSKWKSYELLDIGEGRKLERFDELIVDRPEHAATGKKEHLELWLDADYVFKKRKIKPDHGMLILNRLVLII